MLALSCLNGGCDTDPETLRRSVGAERAEWRRVWPELATRWQEVDGRYVNPKLERVRQEATAYAHARALAGSRGGKAKASKGVANDKQTPSKPLANDLAKTCPSLALALALPQTDPTTVADAPVVVARAVPDATWGHSPAVRRRLGCAHESAIGVHVQEFLDREFTAKLVNAGVTDAYGTLQAWYRETEHAWTGREVGEDAPKFWRKRFEEWRGTTPKAKPTEESTLARWEREDAERAARLAAGVSA
jgi:hypothetical protein